METQVRASFQNTKGRQRVKAVKFADLNPKYYSPSWVFFMVGKYLTLAIKTLTGPSFFQFQLESIFRLIYSVCNVCFWLSFQWSAYKRAWVV